MIWFLTAGFILITLSVLYTIRHIHHKLYVVKTPPEVAYQNLALRRRTIEIEAIPVVEIQQHQDWLKDVEAFKRQEKEMQ